MKHIKIKILKLVPGYAIGSITRVFTDDKGTPTSKFWRDRLEDSKTDDCVEIVKAQLKKENSKESAK